MKLFEIFFSQLEKLYLRAKASSANEILLGIYLFIYGFLFLNYQALSSDEITNFDISRTYNFFSNNVPPGNTGAIFWTLLGIMPSFQIARIVFYVLVITSVFLICEIGNKDTKKSIFLLMLYISMPFAFWTGKILSPEIVLLFLISIALKISLKKQLIAYMVLGVAIGIKLTAIPALIYLALSNLELKFVTRKVGYVIVSVLVATLTNVFNIKRFVQSLLFSEQTSPQVENISKMRIILFDNLKSWDSVQIGSLGHLLIHPIIVVLILITGLLIKTRNVFAFFCAFSCALLLIWLSPSGFGWYWIPFIPVLFNFLSKIYEDLKRKSKSNIIMFVGCSLMLLVNASYNIETSYAAVAEKVSHIQTIKNLDQKCINMYLNKNDSKRVYNITDFGVNLQVSNISRREVITGQFEVINSAMKPGFIIISNRLMGNEYFLRSVISSERIIEIKGQCKSMYILEVR